MLNMLEAHILAHYLEFLLVPYAWNLPDTVFWIVYGFEKGRLDRIVIDDDFQRQAIIGINPKGDLVLLAPFFVCLSIKLGNCLGKCIQLLTMGLELFVVYHPHFINIGLQNCSIVIVTKGFIINISP
ncbi:hypothetical protein ES703_93619 [subsurface metagenome]